MTATTTTEVTPQQAEGQESAVSLISQLAPEFVLPWRWRQRHTNDSANSSWAYSNHRSNGHMALQLGLRRKPDRKVSFVGYFEYPYSNSIPFGWHDWEVQFDLGPISRLPQGTSKVETSVFLNVQGPGFNRTAVYRASSQTNPRLRVGSSSIGRPLLPGKYIVRVGGSVSIDEGAEANHYGEVIADRILYVRGPADTGNWSAMAEHSLLLEQDEGFETQEIGPNFQALAS